MKHVTDVVVGIINKDKRFLVLFHNKLGKYCFPMGKVENNEIRKDALIREMQEELSISILSSYLITTGEVVLPDSVVEYSAYTIVSYAGDICNKEPAKHGELLWLTIEQLTCLIKQDRVVPIIKAVIENITFK